MRYDTASQDEASVPPKRLRWLPVNLGSAADLGALLTLATQNWIGAAIFGVIGLLLGCAQIVRSRGHVVGRAVLAAAAAVAIGGLLSGFAVDRLIVATRDNGHVGQTVTEPPGTSTTSAPPAPPSTPEPATIKSLLDVPSIGGAYERSPQTVSGTREERVLSRDLSCHSATSEEFQLDGEFRVFRTHVGLADSSSSHLQVKFVVRVDGADRDSKVMSGEELQSFKIDVSGGSWIELHVEVTDSNSCGYIDSARAAWVDPVVIQ